MADTAVSKLLEASRRHSDIQQAIKDRAAELGKTIGPTQGQEEGTNGGTHPGQ